MLFGTTLVFTPSEIAWGLTLSLTLSLLVLFAANSLSREPSSPLLICSTSALLGATLAVFWAGNILTLLLAYAVYDLFTAMGRIAAAIPTRRALRDLALCGTGSIAVWAGALISGGEAVDQAWSVMRPTELQVTIWGASTILRLGLFPFHFVALDKANGRDVLVAQLLFFPLTGWALWLRLMQSAGWKPVVSPLMAALGLATWTIGCLLAWAQPEKQKSLAWVSLASSALVLSAAFVSGPDQQLVVAHSLTGWLLALTVLFVGNQLRRGFLSGGWWLIPEAVAAATLIGLPATSGFVRVSPLLADTRGEIGTWTISALVVGDIFLVGALFRDFRFQKDELQQRSFLSRLLQMVSFGLLSLFLLLTGLFPRVVSIGVGQRLSMISLLKAPQTIGWIIWIMSLAIGALFAWRDRWLRERVSFLAQALYDLLRLEWVYQALMNAMGRGLAALRATEEVVGGAGALLWSILLFLVLVLIWRL
jgi:formate hydrogenlyase subunit 3/multisubunit Na+/H+ antiporter MnhD subunit